jgi:hypothetical protein
MILNLLVRLSGREDGDGRFGRGLVRSTQTLCKIDRQRDVCFRLQAVTECPMCSHSK